MAWLFELLWALLCEFGEYCESYDRNALSVGFEEAEDKFYDLCEEFFECGIDHELISPKNGLTTEEAERRVGAQWIKSLAYECAKRQAFACTKSSRNKEIKAICAAYGAIDRAVAVLDGNGTTGKRKRAPTS